MSRAVSDGHIERLNRVSLRLSGPRNNTSRSLRDRSLIAIENYYTVQRFDLAQSTHGTCDVRTRSIVETDSQNIFILSQSLTLSL